MNEVRFEGRHPALTDKETGLPNRLHFDTVFEVLFATGSRGVPLTVLLLEIDGFLPWAKGRDRSEIAQVLRGIGGTLVPLVRRTDLVARVDESRFAFCLMDCNVAGAVLVADRIDGLLDPVRQETGLGFTMGGAAYQRDMKRPEDLIGTVENALRSAQAKGPNQMEFHR